MRMQVDVSNLASGVQNKLTGGAMVLVTAMKAQIEVGMFWGDEGDTLLDITDYASFTVEIKEANDPTLSPLAAQTISIGGGAVNTGLVLSDWQGDLNQHLLFTFPANQLNFSLGGAQKVTYWMAIFGVTTADADPVPIAGCNITVLQLGVPDAGVGPVQAGNLATTGPLNYSSGGNAALSGLTIGKVYNLILGVNDTDLLNGAQDIVASGHFTATATTATMRGTPNASVTMVIQTLVYLTADEVLALLTAGMSWIFGAGAPSGGTGANGNVYVDNSTGNVYQKSAGSWTLEANFQGAHILTGSGAPSGGLGINGDLYINTANGGVYSKAAGSWTLELTITGAAGAAGSQLLFGSGVPGGGTGSNGDVYLDTSGNGNLYKKVTGAWVLQVSIEGPAGVNGATWSQGAGAPSNGSGNNGDFYLRTSNANIYFKAAGVWTSIGSFIGPGGANGTNGTNGMNGSQFTTGTTVPTGGNAGDFYLRVSTGDIWSNIAGTWTQVANLSGAAASAGYQALTVSTGINTNITPGLKLIWTEEVTVGAGSSPYTQTWCLVRAGAQAGAQVWFRFIMPATVWPTVQVYDDTTGGAKLLDFTDGLGRGVPFAAGFYYTGSQWKRLWAGEDE
jgi:hypothetical protein